MTILPNNPGNASLLAGSSHAFANIFALLLQVVIIIGTFVITVPNG